jgi:hypothetical protein
LADVCPDCGGPVDETPFAQQFQVENPRKPIHRARLSLVSKLCPDASLFERPPAFAGKGRAASETL